MFRLLLALGLGGTLIGNDTPLSPPAPPVLAEIANATDVTGPVILERGDGSTVAESEFWAWLTRAGGSHSDLALGRLEADEVTQLVCEFADAMDWSQRGLTEQALQDGRQRALWQAALSRAAYRRLVDGPDGGDTPEAKDARLSLILGAGRDEDAMTARLVAHALETGLDRDPAVRASYRSDLIEALALQARRIDEAALLQRLQADPDAPMADTGPTGRRPECLGGPVLPSLRQAEAAELQSLYLARAASLRLRAQSTTRIVAHPDLNP